MVNVMNNEMSYLLGMICGNGEVHRGQSTTIFSIEIPHKKLQTEDFHDVRLYVKASLADIRDLLEPLIGTGISFVQEKSSTIISFEKNNSDYLTREILRYTGSATSHADMRIHKDVFSFSQDERKQFLKGFCDVTGYIRRSNYHFHKYEHRVYIEIPHNWFMVVDICNLLGSVDVPVQNIDWAHPNMRDGNLVKYNSGKPNFWKKEHQIKIYANEFLAIGFGVIHKNQALEKYSNELMVGFRKLGKDAASTTHRYYWETREVLKGKPIHPAENDTFIPSCIRGKHYDSWKKIAKDLGYVKQN